MYMTVPAFWGPVCTWVGLGALEWDETVLSLRSLSAHEGSEAGTRHPHAR